MLLFNIWKSKTFLGAPIPRLNKLILLHTVVVSHYTLYKMAYLVKGGGKAINSILYSLRETNIVTTEGTINI